MLGAQKKDRLRGLSVNAHLDAIRRYRSQRMTVRAVVGYMCSYTYCLFRSVSCYAQQGGRAPARGRFRRFGLSIKDS